MNIFKFANLIFLEFYIKFVFAQHEIILDTNADIGDYWEVDCSYYQTFGEIPISCVTPNGGENGYWLTCDKPGNCEIKYRDPEGLFTPKSLIIFGQVSWNGLIEIHNSIDDEVMKIGEGFDKWENYTFDFENSSPEMKINIMIAFANHPVDPVYIDMITLIGSMDEPISTTQESTMETTEIISTTEMLSTTELILTTDPTTEIISTTDPTTEIASTTGIISTIDPTTEIASTTDQTTEMISTTGLVSTTELISTTGPTTSTTDETTEIITIQTTITNSETSTTEWSLTTFETTPIDQTSTSTFTTELTTNIISTFSSSVSTAETEVPPTESPTESPTEIPTEAPSSPKTTSTEIPTETNPISTDISIPSISTSEITHPSTSFLTSTTFPATTSTIENNFTTSGSTPDQPSSTNFALIWLGSLAGGILLTFIILLIYLIRNSKRNKNRNQAIFPYNPSPESRRSKWDIIA